MELPELNTRVLSKPKVKKTANERRNLRSQNLFGVFLTFVGQDVFFISESEFYLPEQIASWVKS